MRLNIASFSVAYYPSFTTLQSKILSHLYRHGRYAEILRFKFSAKHGSLKISP